MPMRQTKPRRAELDERAARCELLVFDVDGVLTDGGLLYGPSGEALKRFDVKDGHGLVMARLMGLRCAILTARTSEIVQRRASELGLAAVRQGQKDKRTGFNSLLADLQVQPDKSAYMGDDVNDLGPLALAGLPACPADAVAEVRQAASFVAQSPGGRGAVRELIELVLKAKGLWEDALERMRG